MSEPATNPFDKDDHSSGHYNGPTSPTANPNPPAGVIQKRRVVMESGSLLPNGEVQRHGVVDFVPLDILEQYLTDARGRWQSVTVPEPDVHDPGPGGDAGDTHYPEFVDHPLAGQTVSGNEASA